LNISCSTPEIISGTANTISLSISVPLHMSISYLFFFTFISPVAFLSFLKALLICYVTQIFREMQYLIHRKTDVHHLTLRCSLYLLRNCLYSLSVYDSIDPEFCRKEPVSHPFIWENFL